jgi:hypothetical protein
LLDQLQKGISTVILLKGFGQYLRRGKDVKEEAVHEGNSQGIYVIFDRFVVVIFREVLSFSNFGEVGRQVIGNST